MRQVPPRRKGMRGYYENKDDLRKRLRRIEGQVRGIQRMVENDEYCIDILTQMTAATNALKRVGVGLLDDHIRHCVMEQTEAGKDMVAEATSAIERLVKS
jgi:CsoR family transcriptional regulator, copper-sensing transcriptional repressor